MVQVYQRLLSWVPRKDYLSSQNLIVRPGHFFGFHDKCPWSEDGKYHLSHRFDQRKSTKEIEKGPLEYGLHEGEQLETFRVIGSTHTWNWQQGAILHWLAGGKIGFSVNDLVHGAPYCKIHGLDGRLLQQLPFHIASFSPDGKYGVSYSFGRLGRGAPGYGHFCAANRASPHDADLLIVDLHTGGVTKVLSLGEATRIDPDESMKGAYHFFSHALFSPDGSRFLFYHQWRQKSSSLYTRLYSAGIDGKLLCRFPGKDFSHISWCGNDEIIAYCELAGRVWGYFRYSDGDGEWQSIHSDRFDSDGHPQCSSDRQNFVTDTYPDRYRQQRLYVHDLVSGCTTELASLRIPFEYRGIRRCDFHPRWSPDGKRISFDSAHTRVRSLCIMQCSWA